MTTQTEFKTKKEVKEFLEDNFNFDKITFHKTGEITVKRSFFYTNGASSSKLAEKIENAFPAGTIQIIKYEDDWQNWPKTSYFVVKFKVLTMGR
ncbi:hypothetical protein D3C71_1326370 [compost metagenome]